MKFFAMILMLAFIGIKPATATNQSSNNTSLLTMFKNLFVYCQKKPYVETIEKKECFFDLKKLQSSSVIMNIIMSYVDLHGYVSMIQGSKQMYQDIHKRIGAKYLWGQYTKLLQQEKMTIYRIMMLQEYVFFLETQPIPADYFALRPFDLPKFEVGLNELRLLEIRRFCKLYETLVNINFIFMTINGEVSISFIPAVVIMTINGEVSISFYVEHVIRWTRDNNPTGWENGISQSFELTFDDENNKYLTFNQYEKNIWRRVHKKLTFKYGKDDKLPCSASFSEYNNDGITRNIISCDRYFTEYGSNEKGYYQELKKRERIEGGMPTIRQIRDYGEIIEEQDTQDTTIMLFYYL